MSTLAPALSGDQRQLTVLVRGQSYALPGSDIVEVLRRPRVTRVPHGPPALVGVSNLRGGVLPVVSLARLMGSEPGSEDRVVVFDYSGTVGLLVDAVLRLDVGEGISASQQIDIAALLEARFGRDASRSAASRGHIESAQVAVETQAAQRVLVSFQVSWQSFALPLDAVLEVLRLPDEIARIAGADAAVLGVANVRDRALPIISLAGLLGFSAPRTEAANRRVLIVEYEGARIGLVADTIEAILRLDEAAIDTVPPILQRGRGQAELDAIGRQGGGRPLVSILSVPRLFSNASVGATVSASSKETQTMVDTGADEMREQFVLFELGGEQYGLPIAAVQEVLRLPETVTRLPNAPRFVSGVINLRGRAMPIIDQRQRFEAPLAGDGVRPRVIIVTVGNLQAGFVVDSVSEILSIDAGNLAAAPPLSSERAAVFNRVAHLGDDGQLVLLIDPEELLSRAEQDVIADIASRQNPAGPA